MHLRWFCWGPRKSLSMSDRGQRGHVHAQAFHALYHTDENVLLGAPTGSGKTISAELAMLRVFKHYPGQKIIYIAPLKVCVQALLLFVYFINSPNKTAVLLQTLSCRPKGLSFRQIETASRARHGAKTSVVMVAGRLGCCLEVCCTWQGAGPHRP